MEKEFIPYELALELKELGFDGECFGYYYKPNKEVIHPLIFNKINSVADDNHIGAPLWQQGFDFFREKGFEFHIECRRHTSVKYYEIFLYDGNKSSMVFGKSLSYQEAREACLIKLIELCKKN